MHTIYIDNTQSYLFLHARLGDILSGSAFDNFSEACFVDVFVILHFNERGKACELTNIVKKWHWWAKRREGFPSLHSFIAP